VTVPDGVPGRAEFSRPKCCPGQFHPDDDHRHQCGPGDIQPFRGSQSNPLLSHIGRHFSCRRFNARLDRTVGQTSRVTCGPAEGASPVIGVRENFPWRIGWRRGAGTVITGREDETETQQAAGEPAAYPANEPAVKTTFRQSAVPYAHRVSKGQGVPPKNPRGRTPPGSTANGWTRR